MPEKETTIIPGDFNARVGRSFENWTGILIHSSYLFTISIQYNLSIIKEYNKGSMFNNDNNYYY